MRIIELRYRIHVTCLIAGNQYYSGYHRTNENNGTAYSDKDRADADANFIGATGRYLATVEEFEIPPVNEEA